MGLFEDRTSFLSGPIIPPRPMTSRPGQSVTADTAMRHSAIWACLRLRADLLSTMPLNCYRQSALTQVQVSTPNVLVNPAGNQVNLHEWLYSSQVDLDRGGNAFGIITATDNNGMPAQIELQDLSAVSVVMSKGEIQTYQIHGKAYNPKDIWHERQYTVSGSPIGLSPIAYAAWSIGQFLSAQQYSLSWFADGAIPTAELKNTAKSVTDQEAYEVKNRFRAAVANRDLFVHGSDWEFNPIQAAANATGFIESQSFGIVDICRFFGVPSDLIDAGVPGSAVTYANISQRNQQLLIMHLGPMILRREAKLSQLLPGGRFVRFDTDSLMRMDPESRSLMMSKKIHSRQLAPSEVRLADNMLPLTEIQMEEFDRLFGVPVATPNTANPNSATGGF